MTNPEPATNPDRSSYLAEEFTTGLYPPGAIPPAYRIGGGPYDAVHKQASASGTAQPSAQRGLRGGFRRPGAPRPRQDASDWAERTAGNNGPQPPGVEDAERTFGSGVTGHQGPPSSDPGLQRPTNTSEPRPDAGIARAAAESSNRLSEVLNAVRPAVNGPNPGEGRVAAPNATRAAPKPSRGR